MGTCDTSAKRHNNICRYIHYKVLKHFGMDIVENWFTHNPAEVTIYKKIEVVYDQTIPTTRPVGANRPDILIKDLSNKKTYIIDVSCPIDINVGKKEMEKISKYGALKVEAERMWGSKAEVIPVVVGGLGAVTKNLGDNLAKIPGSPDVYMCQKICLLGSKKILQDVLRRR